MLTLSLPLYRYLPVPVLEIWNPEPGSEIAPVLAALPRPVRVFHATQPLAGFVGGWQSRMTLVTRLGELDTLEPQLSKTTRYHIRRALQRDEMRIDDSFGPADVVRFHAESDAGNPNAPKLARMQSLAALGALSIRVAYSAGEAVCVHAYVDDGRRTRLLHSYSARRTTHSRDDYARIARVNKALHWQNLHWYRERGFTIYDWGGFSGKPDNGIDAFKLQFLGERQTTWCLDGALLPHFGERRLRERAQVHG